MAWPGIKRTRRFTTRLGGSPSKKLVVRLASEVQTACGFLQIWDRRAVAADLEAHPGE